MGVRFEVTFDTNTSLAFLTISSVLSSGFGIASTAFLRSAMPWTTRAIEPFIVWIIPVSVATSSLLARLSGILISVISIGSGVAGSITGADIFVATFAISFLISVSASSSRFIWRRSNSISMSPHCGTSEMLSFFAIIRIIWVCCYVFFFSSAVGWLRPARSRQGDRFQVGTHRQPYCI